MGHPSSRFEVFAVAVRPINPQKWVDRMQYLFGYFAPGKYQGFFGAECSNPLKFRVEAGC